MFRKDISKLLRNRDLTYNKFSQKLVTIGHNSLTNKLLRCDELKPQLVTALLINASVTSQGKQLVTPYSTDSQHFTRRCDE